MDVVFPILFAIGVVGLFAQLLANTLDSIKEEQKREIEEAKQKEREKFRRGL